MKWEYFKLGGAILLLPILFFSQSIPYQTGWPVYIDEPEVSPIKIADIDNDGLKDLFLFGMPDNYQESRMYIFNFNGNIKNGFPLNGPFARPGYSALSDINDDGKLEIIAAWRGTMIINSNGEKIWYKSYDETGCAPTGLSVDDLDNNGILEIVSTCYLGGAVFVFEPDGSLRDGWPVLGLGGMGSSASLGDIDKDGLKEIIVTSDKLYCFKPDGSNCPGFSFEPEYNQWGSLYKPVLIDFNKDGFLEIIYSGWGSESIKLVAIDHNGNIIPPYPLYGFNVPDPAIGDINFDGNYDIVFVRNNEDGAIYSYKIVDLSLFENFPIFPYQDLDGLWAYIKPRLLDLSNDFGEEIAVGCISGALVYDGKLFAFNLQGQVVDGFPSDFLFHRGLTTGCSVDDLDSDGDVEICCGSENAEYVTPRHSNVFCWDVPQPWNRDLADWMMDGFDLQNTGRWRKLYHIDEIQSTIEVIGCAQNPCILPADGNLYPVKIKAKRKFADEYPAGQDVRYSRTLGCGNYEGPVYDNGDGTYTRYLRAPNAECHTTIEGWVNEFKIDSCIEVYFGPSFGFCDSNGVRCEITDVQKAVNKNLGKEPCTICADCEPDGLCSITDIQKIVNCNLGLNISCH